MVVFGSSGEGSIVTCLIHSMLMTWVYTVETVDSHILALKSHYVGTGWHRNGLHLIFGCGTGVACRPCLTTTSDNW